MLNHRPEIKKVFCKKREFLFKMLFTTLGANNTNRKLRYTQFWISWNYFKAKCKLHQCTEMYLFLTKKKEIFFHRKVAFQKKLIRAFLSLHCVIKIADSSSSTPRIIIKALKWDKKLNLWYIYRYLTLKL